MHGYFKMSRFSLIILVLLRLLAPANSYYFEEFMKILRHQCGLVLYSHEFIEGKGENYPESDHALVLHTLKRLGQAEIPLQFWVINRLHSDSSWLRDHHQRLYQNRKGTCTVSIWFLKARISSTSKIQTIQPMPWAMYGYRLERTENDYTILGFEHMPGYSYTVDLTYGPYFRQVYATNLPGNLIFVRMRSYERLREKRFIMLSVGGLRYYCPSRRYFCVDWFKGDEFRVATPMEFHSKLGKLSSYNSGFYNFHKAGIYVREIAGSLPPRFWEEVRKLGYRRGLLPPADSDSNRNTYGSYNAGDIHSMWKYVEILENIFNATVLSTYGLKWGKGKQIVDPEYIRWPAVAFADSREAKPITVDRKLYYGYNHINFLCVDFQHSQIQFYTLLHPMDKWTWLSFACTGVALALTFRKYTKNPVFNLITLFFAQGDGEPVKKFKCLLVLWSCLGLLLTAGYSSLISSLLTVPEQRNHPRDLKEIYEHGYKLVLYWSDDIQFQGVVAHIRKDVLEEPKFKEKNKHLLRLDEESIRIPKPVGDSHPSLSEVLGKYGKFCRKSQNGMLPSCQIILEAYEGIICFSNTEPFITGLRKMAFTRATSEVLRRGAQILKAVGILDWLESYFGFFQQMEMTLHYTEIRGAEYRTGYFFRITRDKEPYLFTIRNVQGQMIFYFGLICAGVSFSGLVLEFLLLCKWKILYEKTRARMASKSK